MGKRGPKVNKNQQNQDQNSGKVKQSGQTTHFEVFTPNFYETIQSFKKFYRQVLALKSKETGCDVTGQFGQVSKRVKQKIQEQSTVILKDQLSDIEGWIKHQQQSLEKETQRVETAYRCNFDSLIKTGAFTDDQVRRQLEPVQSKIDSKRNTHQSYGKLLQRSKNIYE